LDIGIPAGPATLVSVGNTTTLTAGSNATVTGTTSGGNLTLSFAIPRGSNGINGTTPTITASATTLSAGSSATVTATATNGGANVALNFGIPRGVDGTGGGSSNLTLSDATPSDLGTAVPGTSTLASRSDHTHNLPVIAYANLSGVPANFPTNTTLVSGLSTGYSAVNHAHNYVQSLNNLSGNLTLAAGSNVTLTANGSTLTLSATGGVGANDALDGGDYVGQLVYGIAFGTQPQSVNTTSTATINLVSLSPSGTAPASVAQIPGGLTGATASVVSPYSNVTFSVVTSVNNGASWTTVSSQAISSSGVYSPPTFSTTSATNGTRTILGSYNLMRSDTPTANASWTSTGYSWDTSNDGGYSVAFNGVRFVAVAKTSYGSNTSTTRALSVFSSSDGASWTGRTLPMPGDYAITSNWKTVAAVNGTFIVSGVARQVISGNATFYPSIWTSSDGVSWARSTFGFSSTATLSSGVPAADVFLDLASSGTLAVGVNGTTARYTTDGTTWGTSTLPVSCNRISYAAGFFWAFATSSGTDVCYSVNGTSWTLGAMPTSAQWQDMAGAATGFALSTGGQYATATIGATYGSASLTALASATSGSPVSYQWQLSSDAGTTWTNINGATSTTLSLASLTTADNGKRYRVAASSTGSETVYSQTAILTVT
jgi:hypothetical protein